MILDDLSYVRRDQGETSVLFVLIAERYEHKSLANTAARIVDAGQSSALGGGFGWQSRRRGLTVDNLVAADVVLASGEFVQTSTTQHPDLFWALRGGGGNFGVVTSFEYQLHPLGPEVLAGLVVYPMDQARQVFEGYRQFTAAASDEMTAWLVLRKAPPLPFLPADAHGKPVVVVAFCWIGDLSKGEKMTKPLHGFATPYGVHAGPMPFAGWQTAFDPLLTPAARNYLKSHDFKGLNGGVERILCDAIAKLPSDWRRTPPAAST